MSGRSPRWFTGIKSPYEENFADNTWAQIIAACQKKNVPETWKIGDQRLMTINGTDYLIDIIGKNHDDYSDDSGKAPLTFQMHDCYSARYAVNSPSQSNGSWANSSMRSAYLPAIFDTMPSDVQMGIRAVAKLTSAGGSNSHIGTTADKLFLLSEVEIFGNTRYSYSGEGTQYDYYKAGNSKVKKLSGSARYWWERSCYAGDATNFCYVSTSGTADFNESDGTNGVSFAFCF